MYQGERHVAEGHGGGGGAKRAFGLKRRPRPVGAARDLAVFLGARGIAAAARHGGGSKVLAVPELSTEWIFLEHVNVVETLGREITLILDQRVVWPRHVGKTGAARRSDAFAAGGGDLGPGQAEHAAGSGPRVAVHEHGAAFVGGKERLQQHLGPRFVDRKALAHVDHVPAEMPDSGLRQDW